jgi:hypothetical protein
MRQNMRCAHRHTSPSKISEASKLTYADVCCGRICASQTGIRCHRGFRKRRRTGSPHLCYAFSFLKYLTLLKKKYRIYSIIHPGRVFAVPPPERNRPPGCQFTCFTGTKVQILTPEEPGVPEVQNLNRAARRRVRDGSLQLHVFKHL